MRSYVRGEAPRELLELLAKESERFRAAFFGEIEAPVPSDEVKEFIEKCRDRQRRGPSGKGSLVNKGDARI